MRRQRENTFSQTIGAYLHLSLSDPYFPFFCYTTISEQLFLLTNLASLQIHSFRQYDSRCFKIDSTSQKAAAGAAFLSA